MSARRRKQSSTQANKPNREPKRLTAGLSGGEMLAQHEGATSGGRLSSEHTAAERPDGRFGPKHRPAEELRWLRRPICERVPTALLVACLLASLAGDTHSSGAQLAHRSLGKFCDATSDLDLGTFIEKRKQSFNLSTLAETDETRVTSTTTTSNKNDQKAGFCPPHTVGHQRHRHMASAPPPTQTTSSNSGADPQQQAEQQQQQLGKKVFCFYDIQDDFRPQDLNACLCTHVVYSYVAVRKNLSFIAGKKGKSRWGERFRRAAQIHPFLSLSLSLFASPSDLRASREARPARDNNEIAAAEANDCFFFLSAFLSSAPA